jgi:hypothetical protein
MPPVLLFIVVGIISGAVIGLQGPLASIITHRLGLLESVFIVHLGGTLVASGGRCRGMSSWPGCAGWWCLPGSPS